MNTITSNKRRNISVTMAKAIPMTNNDKIPIAIYFKNPNISIKISIITLPRKLFSNIIILFYHIKFNLYYHC